MPLSAKRVLRQFRYVMYFDGVDDYVVVRYSPSINPGSEATIEGWHYFTGSARGISGSKESHYRLFDYDPQTNIFEWDIGDGVQWLVSVKFNPRITINNNWLHVASVIKWVEGWGKLYFNASLTKTTSFRAGVVSGNFNHLHIGAWEAQGYWFAGFTSILRIYTRALSDSEIAWNYQYPDNPVKSGLVLWLQADPSNVKDIDGDGILEWLDLSGNNNHGKIYGATLVQLIKSPARVLTPARTLSPVR